MECDGTGVVFTEMLIFCSQTRGPWKKISTKSIFKKSLSKFDFSPKFVYNNLRNKTKQPDDIPQRTGAYNMVRIVIGI